MILQRLSRALVELQQTQQALERLISVQVTSGVGNQLSSKYAGLLRLRGWIESETGEVRGAVTCDLEKMRADDAFLNDFTLSADRYDAYVRDGLRPWITHFDEVHALVDAALGLAHGPAEG